MEAQLTKNGSRYLITWDNGVEAHVSRIKENPERIKCEIALTLNGQLLTRSSPVVTSESGKDSLIRKLQRRRPKEDWGIDHEILIEQMCALIIDTYREGEPPVQLEPIPDDESMTWRIENLLPESQPTLLFADGGSGKSMLACLFAVCVDQGVINTELGITVEPGRALFLDWETSAEEIAKRVKGIMRGMGIQGNTGIVYRRCSQPHISEVDRFLDLCDEHSIDLIVCDSLGLATGGALEEADATLQFFNALRMIGRTSLVVSHINKAGSNFGSVYANNSARMAWSADGSKNEDSSVNIAMFHKKANNVAKQSPIGWHIQFDEDQRSIIFTRRDIFDTDAAKELSVPALMMSILKENDTWTSKEKLTEMVAAFKDVKPELIRANLEVALSRAKKQGKIETDAFGLYRITPADNVSLEI